MNSTRSQIWDLKSNILVFQCTKNQVFSISETIKDNLLLKNLSQSVKKISSKSYQFVKSKLSPLFQHQVIIPALVLSCSSCLGLSSLTLPGAIEKSGLFLYILLLAIAGSLNYFSNTLWAKCAEITKSKNSSQILERVLGKWKLLPDVMTFISNCCLIISCNLTWVTFCEDLLFIFLSIRPLPLLKTFLLILPNLLLTPFLLKNQVADVAFPAAVSFLAVLFLLFFVLYSFGIKCYNDFEEISPAVSLIAQPVPYFDISTAPRTLCVLLFACSYQQNIIDLCSDLYNPGTGEDTAVKNNLKSIEESVRQEKNEQKRKQNKRRKSESEDLNTENKTKENQMNSANSAQRKVRDELKIEENIIMDQDFEVKSRKSIGQNLPPGLIPNSETFSADTTHKRVLQTVKTILRLENIFKVTFFFVISVLGFFSFHEQHSLYHINILTLFKTTNPVIVYVNVFMAVSVLITGTFIFKPTRDLFYSALEKHVFKGNPFGSALMLHVLITALSLILVLCRVSYISIFQIISFYMSPLVSIYLPVFLFARLTRNKIYHMIVMGLAVVTALNIWFDLF